MAPAPAVEAPQAFLCPITHEAMRDPVIDKDGNSYEREAIVAWLAVHGTSPITRAPMTLDDLRPNRALLDLINPDAAPGVTDPSVVTQAEAAQVLSPERAAELHAAETAAVALSAAKVPGEESDVVVVTVTPPAGTVRTPVDLVAVVDVSGSMSDAASMPGSEDVGLSILDIVKHALRTILSSLGPNDRLAIVAYSSKATVTLPLTCMTADGRKKALDATTSLVASGGTNLWDGLRTGIDLLAGVDANGRPLAPPRANAAGGVFLLTDGMPNIEPPRGHIPMLQRHLATATRNVVGETFGFGYNLDSLLLRDIAREMGGSYSFIPDAGMVGTVFIHAIANFLSTLGTDATITVDGATPLHAIAGPAPATGSKALVPRIPYGQPRSLAFRMPAPWAQSVSVQLEYDAWHGAKRRVCVRQDLRVDASDEATARAAREDARCRAAALITRLASAKAGTAAASDSQLSAAAREVQSLAEHMRTLGMAELADDLGGQVAMAFEGQYYWTWGGHYLRSIAFAHGYQQCNNFKDPGVQAYGGELFRALRDDTDALFDKLPPPEPSRTLHEGRGGVRSMAVFNSSSNPCWAGDCLVAVRGGVKRADALRRGDVLASGARVACVVRTELLSPPRLVRLGDGLRITEWHPVVDPSSGRWAFPAEIGEAQEDASCSAVYSVLLDGAGEVVVGGVTCAALAHGAAECPVRAHAFFGTQRVRRALEQLPGWPQGSVALRGTVRDPETGLVDGLQAASGEVAYGAEPGGVAGSPWRLCVWQSRDGAVESGVLDGCA
ncbi:unnamed protein product [Pedinophyceae sp. YPF-701]|nr:unnamed protein product [Pedinophyceae sp. YPF-701]